MRIPESVSVWLGGFYLEEPGEPHFDCLIVVTETLRISFTWNFRVKTHATCLGPQYQKLNLQNVSQLLRTSFVFLCKPVNAWDMPSVTRSFLTHCPSAWLMKSGDFHLRFYVVIFHIFQFSETKEESVDNKSSFRFCESCKIMSFSWGCLICFKCICIPKMHFHR